jgi:glycosyltransferase involved in cell wall biosynthesis
VKVTGTVPDVRPYIAHARVSVAPLRIARGIQNKVLEAMAMARPVVVSGAALEGIDAQPGREILLAGHEQQFIDATCALLSASLPDIGHAARRKVLARYGWASNLEKLDTLLEAGHLSATPSSILSQAADLLAGERA